MRLQETSRLLVIHSAALTPRSGASLQSGTVAFQALPVAFQP
jgi:hypothetical protein